MYCTEPSALRRELARKVPLSAADRRRGGNASAEEILYVVRVSDPGRRRAVVRAGTGAVELANEPPIEPRTPALVAAVVGAAVVSVDPLERASRPLTIQGLEVGEH